MKAESTIKFNTLVEAVAYWAEATPDKTCLIEAETDRRLSYGEFWRLIRVFAKRLLECGLKKGDRVVVRVGPLLNTFVAQYGVYLAGGVYCPVEKHMKALKMLEMLEYYDSALLISSEAIEFEGKFIELSSVCEDGEALEEFAFPNPEDMCAIVFTTGTTGKAKGVMLSAHAILTYSQARKSVWGSDSNEVFLWVQPLDRVSGIKIFGPTLLSGGIVAFFNGIIFINDFLQFIKRSAATTVRLQSYAVNLLLDVAPNMLSDISDQLRLLLLGGGALDVLNITKIQMLLPNTKIFFTYGATECSPIAFNEITEGGVKLNCVGKQFPCMQVSITDENGEPMEKTNINHFGIITCEGPTIMLGYWKDPELTATVMRGGKIQMTDVGYIDDEGLLFVLGRSDDVITTGGFKIAPYEIESVTNQIQEIAECACVPQKDRVLGEVPHLYVVMKADAEFSAKTIFRYLSERIESYKIPRTIREINALPHVSGSYKINRKELTGYEC